MSYFDDMYKKFKTNSEYNPEVEGEDIFNIAGYDPTDSGGTGYFAVSAGNTGDVFDAWAGIDNYSHINGITLYANSGLSGTTGHGGMTYARNDAAALALDAEL